LSIIWATLIIRPACCHYLSPSNVIISICHSYYNILHLSNTNYLCLYILIIIYGFGSGQIECDPTVRPVTLNDRDKVSPGPIATSGRGKPAGVASSTLTDGEKVPAVLPVFSHVTSTVRPHGAVQVFVDTDIFVTIIFAGAAVTVTVTQGIAILICSFDYFNLYFDLIYFYILIIVIRL
jgi:hypothetical protein